MTLLGYNVTILAYGQTSSGKTFTMGTSDNESIEPEDEGIIPRGFVNFIFFDEFRSIYDVKKFHLLKFIMKI